MDIQRQYLDKGRQMSEILRSKLDQTQNSNATWIETTIKRPIITPVNKFGPPIFSFKRKQEASCQNRQILTVFSGNLDYAIEAQKGIPLDYGSEFREITGIKNLFCHHEYKERIVHIIQKESRYHISTIEEATRKS